MIHLNHMSTSDYSQGQAYCTSKWNLGFGREQKEGALRRKQPITHTKRPVRLEHGLLLAGASIVGIGMLAFSYLAFTRGLSISLIHLDFWWGAFGH